MSSVLYFDYNATHPPFPEILHKNIGDYIQNFYNPSGLSRYSLGRQALLEDVRTYLAGITGKPKNSFVFCSTGTESNHFLIGSLFGSGNYSDGVYVSPFEHSSIYGALETYKIPFSFIGGSKSGLLDIDNLYEKMKISPKPVIALLAGNETGVVQPYREIGRICREFGMPFLSDLMQAYGKIEIDYSEFSGFTFSGHKIGAGMGAAVACIPDGIQSEFRLFRGGNQENGLRAGTENTVAIAALKDASVIQQSILEKKNVRLLEFREVIENTLEALGGEIIGKQEPRLPSTSFVILPSEDIDFILLGLEERKIIVATGSSCKSRAREASPTLLRMGYSKEEALRAVRISTGYFTNREEVEVLCKEFHNLINLFS